MGTTRCYLELRIAAARGTDSLAADITRHLHTRQYLGKTVIICDHPLSMLSAVRKQWLKLSRFIQKQRASTLNADKILKYTHVITHMQHHKFTAMPPLENPDADVYVLHPDDITLIPPQCWSVYTVTRLAKKTFKNIAGQLPADGLVVDYQHSAKPTELHMAPKSVLEQRVKDEWRQALHFLKDYHIDITTFTNGELQNVAAIDDALDTLLGIGHKFLSVANEFQRTLELARPLRVPKKLREDYDSFILLAHRVQALSQSAFTQRFLETYNEDDTFFLHDNGRLAWTGETLAEAIARHHVANRKHLTRALQALKIR